MPVRSHLLVVILALALGCLAWSPISAPAWAQDSKGWLGVEVRDVTKAEADKLGWDTPRGAMVATTPERGSPAETAGLMAGDIIVAVERTLIDTAAEFDAAVAGKQPGSELRLQVLSGGRERRVSATLAVQPRVQVTGDMVVPQLMLDTGGHMSAIRGLSFTPDGKQLVTSSEDKVIRVWDWQAGKTVRTIRGQAGPGTEGMLYAMAMSPDGRWLVAGGWTDRAATTIPCCGDIRLYDFATGTLRALLKGHTSVVNSLAFSPDGTRLVSGSGLGDVSVIIWNMESRKLLHRLLGHKDAIYSVAFTPDGERVVTASDDNTLKLWSVKDGKEITTLTGHASKVFRVAVSPVDGSIASGSDDGQIRLWNGKTGKYLRTLANQGSVGWLSFSPDGKRLLVTCGYTGCNYTQRVLDVAADQEIVAYAKHDNIVLSAAMSRDGQLFATAGGNSQQIHIWGSAGGDTRHVLVGTGAPSWSVGMSADGRTMVWGSIPHGGGNQLGKLEYKMRLPAPLASNVAATPSSGLGVPERIGADEKAFVRATAVSADHTMVHRKGGPFGYDALLDLKKGGQTLVTIERGPTAGYQHRSYSFTPDGQTIISGGGNGFITAYDLKGQSLGDFVGHESAIWAVTPSPDGRYLVSGSADQTVRLWNLKTRELLVTLVHGTDGEWVMWTPQGYYTGSPGADKTVGWQINKGPEHAADYVGADQLRRRLNRPDIVQKAIVLASAERAVRETPGTTFKLADLLAKPVPKFRIVSPASGTTARGGRALIKLAVEDVPDPIKAVRVQVNGRQVSEITPDIGSGGLKPGEQELDVPLSKGRNDVRITLVNNTGEKAETITILHEGEGGLDKRGTLYILAIGVDRYSRLGNTCGPFGTDSCDLRYSGADARRLVEAAERRLGPSHTDIVKRVLVNGGGGSDAPTARNILNAIDLLKQAKEIDTVLLYIAGHGVNDGSSYRFLATDAERAGSAFAGATVVHWQILQDAVEAAKGRRILFLDTCHSGNAYSQTLGNAVYHANIITYASARFDQEALEDARLGHGLFTYAVVEGLEGKGNPGTKREISTNDLADYVVRRVDQLAKAMKGEQAPQYFKGRDAEDYVLARW